MSEIAERAADVAQSRGATGVDVAFVLGTGLGNMADSLENPVVVPYADLPGFPTLTVSGHDGNLAIGTQEGVGVAYMQGRAHYYEKGDPRCMESPIETLALLGAQIVVFTASVGSVNADLYPGNLALVTDHINFNGMNPLIGASGDGGFVSMIDAYDPRLGRRFKRAAVASGVTLREGVYMWFTGPSFETPAEVKMAKSLGADVLGMSVAPEVVLARRLGLRTAAVCIVANFGTGFMGGSPSHSETRNTAAQGGIALRRLIRGFLKTRDVEQG
jgi:purine-nucleoside phosphorylase